jgi:NAD(P)-dependent dehydrogenase (short-subunit alcohol dehydrogenase family)
MVAQAFQNHLAKNEGSKLILISSRAGSLDHIHRSGDIAYRSSKTALNCVMKCISFDFKNQKTIVVSINPGWIKTDMGGKNAVYSAEESARGIRQVISGLKLENTGQFFNFDGQIVPW